MWLVTTLLFLCSSFFSFYFIFFFFPFLSLFLFSFSFYLSIVNFTSVFENWWKFSKIDEFFKIDAFWEFNELFANLMNFSSKSMNFFQNWWTIFQFNEPFLKFYDLFPKVYELFFNSLTSLHSHFYKYFSAYFYWIAAFLNFLKKINYARATMGEPSACLTWASPAPRHSVCPFLQVAP